MCLASLLAASCGGAPPPTIVNLTLRASADVNPSTGGTPAPIALRVYQLAAPAAFNGAEFFQVFDQDDATLKADAAKKQEFVLAPGESKSVTLSPDATIKALGFFAGYRDFQSAAWRKTWDVPPNATTDVTVIAGRAGLAVEPPKK